MKVLRRALVGLLVAALSFGAAGCGEGKPRLEDFASGLAIKIETRSNETLRADTVCNYAGRKDDTHYGCTAYLTRPGADTADVVNYRVDPNPDAYTSDNGKTYDAWLATTDDPRGPASVAFDPV